MNFTSDNSVGAAPEMLEALARANDGTAASYGGDEITRLLQSKVSEVFERKAHVFPVITGTAANALSLASFVPPWGAVICADFAHIEEDECGAPEFYTGGAKLIGVAAPDGKLTPAAIGDALGHHHGGAVHHVQPKAVSLTQASELGRVYRADEVAAIGEVASGAGLALHMDGARFANAVASLNAAPADLTWRAGVDVLSLGATKDGAFGAEMVVLFDEAKAEEMAFRRKRAGHLLSKMRFVSAQLEAWLEDDLWLRLAAHANAMATQLAEGLSALPGVSLLHPVEANELFVRMPVAMDARLRANGALYFPWPDPSDTDGTRCFRLVSSFATEASEVAAFLATAREAAGAGPAQGR